MLVTIVQYLTKVLTHLAFTKLLWVLKAKVEGNILINKLIFDDVTRTRTVEFAEVFQSFQFELVLCLMGEILIKLNQTPEN